MSHLPTETEQDHQLGVECYRRLRYLSRIKVHFLVYYPTADILEHAVAAGNLPPDVQDRLRGRGSSEKAARAIQLARQAGLRVQLIACLTRDNIDRLDEVLDYGLDLDVGFCFQLLSALELDDQAAECSIPDHRRLIESLEYLVRLRRQRHRRAKAIASHRSELEYCLDLLKNGSPGCQCTLVTATMLPDCQLIFCGNAKNYESYDAVQLGLAGPEPAPRN